MARSSSPSHRAFRREQAVLLSGALEQLPAAYREVLILRHLEGLSFPEVARRMSRTVLSVKKLWARALPRLRDALGDIS
jgi:RNA polymerase sigma-70 factor (ECF subfamily)